MNQLVIKITKKEYPYQEKYDLNIFWALISLNIVTTANDNIKLFDLNWDVRPLFNWLINNQNQILNENFPQEINNSLSIAENIYRFYNSEDELKEEALDKMFEYRKTHGFRFSLRGTNIPDIYLGKNNENYEISIFEQDEIWRYLIDIDNFFIRVIDFYNRQLTE